MKKKKEVHSSSQTLNNDRPDIKIDTLIYWSLLLRTNENTLCIREWVKKV